MAWFQIHLTIQLLNGKNLSPLQIFSKGAHKRRCQLSLQSLHQPGIILQEGVQPLNGEHPRPEFSPLLASPQQLLRGQAPQVIRPIVTNASGTIPEALTRTTSPCAFFILTGPSPAVALRVTIVDPLAIRPRDPVLTATPVVSWTLCIWADIIRSTSVAVNIFPAYDVSLALTTAVTATHGAWRYEVI